MPDITGIDSLRKKLKTLVKFHKKATGKQASVIVGYTQNYAIRVHENLASFHRVGQSKFLEQPARELGKELGEIVKIAVKKGVPLEKALVLAGLRLQRESQKLVPVDTGALKDSAFTKIE